MRGDQPADDAERADAPAERVPRTPVASAAGDTAGAPAGGGRQCNRRPDGNRCRRCHGPRLPVARAVRPVHVDAGRRQCRDAVLAGLCTGCVAKDPVAAERRHVIERSDAWAGEHACNGDEVRWGHRAARHATRATVPVRRGTVVANRDIVVSRRRPVDQINLIFASVSGRLVRGERCEGNGRGDTRQVSGWRGMMREPYRCVRRCAARRRQAAMPVRAGPAPRASSDPCGADSRHPS